MKFSEVTKSSGEVNMKDKMKLLTDDNSCKIWSELFTNSTGITACLSVFCTKFPSRFVIAAVKWLHFMPLTDHIVDLFKLFASKMHPISTITGEYLY